jgi:vacuolar protein 8
LITLNWLHGSAGKVARIEALSSIASSLSRDTDERSEAIAVLLDLTDIPQVRHRIPMIKGCIVFFGGIEECT